MKFFKLLRTCVRNKKKHISLLDYGCGLGYLMEVAAKHNFNVSGIEYNEFAVTYIKNQYNYDVRHFDGGNDYFDKSKKFDVITFFDVIEHLTEPEKALKMAFDGLEDNGVLAILTMDMSSPVARVLDEKFEDIRRRDHIYFFSRKNLRQFLLKNNFEILKIKKFGKTFNIEALFHRIQNISLTLSKICLFFLKVFPFIKGCSLYINPGTKILIFAKKITPGRH
ncbi:MAG: class I SAM-dependent methyltransferase [Candidatus Omnitrophica bacterium]|nr:class I SAM-dependent methyltransferase [Candidatus Omnitrophota bacterium]